MGKIRIPCSHLRRIFLADLLVNTLQPQAVNLLIDKFPALQKAVEKQEIGKYLTVIVTYDEGADYVGIANRGWVEDDNTYPDNNFVYSLTVNASSLADHKEGDIAVITRDTDSKELTDLANTVVHELFHCFSDDYNRPGLTGRLHDGDTLLDYSENVRFPTWFVEGTASTVENSWQFRQGLLKLLRTPFRSDDPLDNYTKDVLLERYVDGKYTLDENGNYKCDCNFDIEYSRGKDRYGLECDDTPSVYVSGYLACMYLYELAAAGDASIGSSRSTVGENTVIDSGKLRVNTLDTLQNVIHQVLDIAVDDGYLKSNPADRALTELKRIRKGDARKRKPLTQEEQRAFLEYTRNSKVYSRWYPLFTALQIPTPSRLKLTLHLSQS